MFYNEKIKNSLISSVCELGVVHPFDVYKTIRQQNPRFTVSQFLKSNINFKYRGILARGSGSLPMRTTFWISQDYGKQLFPLKTQTPIKNAKETNFSLAFLKHYGVIGSFSGFFQTFIDCPIENFKIYSINQINLKPSFKTLYNGYYANLSRNIIFAAFVYGANDLSNRYNFNSFLMGGLGGFVGCVLSHPIDYLKTIKQGTHPEAFRTYAQIINQTVGYQRYFTGCIPRASMGFLSMGVGSFILNLLHSVNSIDNSMTD